MFRYYSRFGEGVYTIKANINKGLVKKNFESVNGIYLYLSIHMLNSDEGNNGC